MKGKQQNWLLEMWKIKLSSWREPVRLLMLSGFAILRARILPSSEMNKLEGRLGPRQRCGEDTVLLYAGKWFAVLDRLRLRPSCLVRSLALARVLRGEGHDAHLVFGVRSDNGDVEGHCWVAVGDRPLTEAPADYKELRYD
jgi:hypothetical protein